MSPAVPLDSSGPHEKSSNNSVLRKLLRQIECLRTIEPEIQAQALSTFLVTAINDPEPVAMVDIAAQVGIAQSSCSRNVALLGMIHRRGRPGHQLVESYENPLDRRNKLVKLTPKGRRLAQTLIGG